MTKEQDKREGVVAWVSLGPGSTPPDGSAPFFSTKIYAKGLTCPVCGNDNPALYKKLGCPRHDKEGHNRGYRADKVNELEEEIAYMRGRLDDAIAAGQKEDADIFRADIDELETELEEERGY